MTREGTAPPDRRSLIGDIKVNVNKFEMTEVDEVGGTVTEHAPAPPTPVKYRATGFQLINHIILDINEKVDTVNYYSDKEEDNEPSVDDSHDSFVDIWNMSTDDKTVNMQPTSG